MASSSLNDSERQEEGEDDTEKWLELGLGLCPSNTKTGNKTGRLSASPPSFHSELGLGLGFDDNDDRVRNGGYVTPCLNHHSLVHDEPSLPSYPSYPSPSSSACQRVLLLQHHHEHGNLGSFSNRENQQTPMVSRTVSYVTRPETGLWFSLRTLDNRRSTEAHEGLPQIPKAYIRVRDGNVTVFMVKTYLVKKLGLASEAEIDISCMGQKLSHSQTLKHVRDVVWLPGLINSFREQHIAHLDHLMSLYYGRSCFYE